MLESLPCLPAMGRILLLTLCQALATVSGSVEEFRLVSLSSLNEPSGARQV